MTTPPRRIGVEINPHIIGGAEWFLRTLFVHLDRSLFVPVAFAAAPGRWEDHFDTIVETHVIPYVNADGSPADVADHLRRFDFDLVQSSYFSPATAFAAAQAAIPHVWRMGGHVDALERQWSPGDKDKLMAIIKLTSRRVICASRFLRTQFERVGEDGVDVIYNGVDLSAFPKPIRADATAPLSVAMVAHLVPQKRHEIFLRAAAEVVRMHPRVRFFIFGGSYARPELRSYEESLHGLARDLRIAEAVEFRELLRGQRLDVIARSDIVALPGVNEGASNAVVEAMALSLPVVATRSGGNAEMLEDQVTGLLVEPEDAAALAAALIQLLADASRRAAMGTAGRERVARMFEIGRCARDYEAFYTRVLAPGV